jgi:hypothetical protein
MFNSINSKKSETKLELMGDDMESFNSRKSLPSQPSNEKTSLALNIFVGFLFLAFLGLIALHFMKSSAVNTNKPSAEVLERMRNVGNR